MISVFSRLEKACLPFPETMTLQGGCVERKKFSGADKVQFCAHQALSLFVSSLLLPLAALYSAAEVLIPRFVRQIQAPELAPIADNLIEELAEAYPLVHGFSQSLFQDEGLGTYASPTELEGVSNWNRWLNAERIEEAGGLLNDELRDHFVTHSLNMMELFPEVTHWMTFNEPGSYAMQSHIRRVYPPGKSGDLAGAGRLLANILAAHSMIYRQAKKFYGDRVQIGITHQWLKMLPLEGNLLERLICHMVSKITHYSIYNFFKTGCFEYEIAGNANIRFEIPEEEFASNHRFLDFIAPQFYGYPRIKAGWNGGHAYPGYQIKNFTFWKFGFTFGASCHPGEKMMAFAPKYDPESLRDCLKEAAVLGPIAITETGCDSMIQEHGATGDHGFTRSEETQKSYFSAIAPILKEYKDKIMAIFIWTLIRGQLEWDRGDYPALGVLPLKVDENRNIVGVEMTPSAALIQKIYQEKMRQIASQQAAA